jgi:hypothetical protein
MGQTLQQLASPISRAADIGKSTKDAGGEC